MPSRRWFIRCFQIYAERRKSSNSRNMCYAGIRLLESPWWADRISLYDVIQHAAMPLRNFNNNNLSRKHPLGNDFTGEDDAGTGYTPWQVVPSLWRQQLLCQTLLHYSIAILLLHPYKIFSPIPAQQPRTPETNPSGGMFDVITHKHTFLGAWTTRTSLVRPQESDGISCVMERFAWCGDVETGFIPEKHIKHNKVIPCKNWI